MMTEKPFSRLQAVVQEDTYFRVMRLLEEVHSDMSQRDLAAHVGISLGSLNYCLRALRDNGFVKLENFQKSKHKFKYIYVLTPAGVSQKISLTARFLKRKMQEYEALKSEIEGLEADLSVREGGAREAAESANWAGFRLLLLSFAAVRARGCGPWAAWAFSSSSCAWRLRKACFSRHPSI